MLHLRKRLYPWVERTVLAGGYWRSDARSVWSPAGRLVFVCSGNICRSPYAEAIARARGMDAISCGTQTHSGLPADSTAIAEAARRNVDLSSHRTTRWEDVKLLAGDIVVATELKHALAVARRAKSSRCRVVMMSSLLLPQFDVIWDPYGLSPDVFNYSFDLIDRAVGKIDDITASDRV